MVVVLVFELVGRVGFPVVAEHANVVVTGLGEGPGVGIGFFDLQSLLWQTPLPVQVEDLQYVETFWHQLAYLMHSSEAGKPAWVQQAAT